MSLESLSTSVAAAETVIDSVAAPTVRVTSTRWRAFTATLNFSVVSEENPGASALMV